ncbi:MAG TPA: hypothetical protein VMB73_09950 [Acetobacteraceae bacterium]|nr:hypothetical protein [Acetobacteraceae bacterium]
MKVEYYQEGTVVAYNANSPKGIGIDLDGFIARAQRATRTIGYTGVKNLAEKLTTSYGDGKICALLLVDHGAAGIQGVGSGTGHDLTEFKNFNAVHFGVSGKVEAALPVLAGEAAGRKPAPSDVMLALHAYGMSGVIDFQAPYLRAMARCIARSGVLFLCGCSVAQEDGAKMIRDIALYFQNCISVVASNNYVTWIDGPAKNTFKPAIWVSGKARPMRPYDLVGFMGGRVLLSEELQWIIDNTVITESARTPRRRGK